METKWQPFYLCGIIASITFTVFTLISLVLYPTPFSPFYEWMSNLGNINLNPSGALIFNFGCIITGIILLPFIFSFYRWISEVRWKKIFIIVSIILGIFASISLIGIGLFPETSIKLHTIFASEIFESTLFIILFMILALHHHPKFKRTIAYWGIVAILTDLMFGVMLSLPWYQTSLANFHPQVPLPIFEWVSVFTFLIWIAMMSYTMYLKRL